MLSQKIKDTIKWATLLLEKEKNQETIDTICFELKSSIKEYKDSVEIIKCYNTLEELKKDTQLKAGDIVKTKGYYSIGDNGDAEYEIMEYEDWWSQLPNYLKLVAYHTDRIGCNQTLYRNPVDGYGNHIIDNGLVAKLVVRNNIVRVEQYGCIEGRKDNTDALVHLFGNIHTGTIEFGKDRKYELYYRMYNRGHYDAEKIYGDNFPFWLSANSFKANEYALISGCRHTGKPALGNVKDLKLIGNNCTIRIPDEEFWKNGGSADFATFEFGGVVDGLEITGFNFEPNGLHQTGEYVYTTTTDEEGNVITTKKFQITRTCNHTLSYFSSGIGQKATESTSSALFKKYNLDYKDYCFELQSNPPTFSNVNIHDNKFYANGTAVDTSDGGGDHVLIINPIKSENVFIEDNEFYDWGRWVFAVDLGGSGERFYNYKFNRNKCIQTKDNFYVRNNHYKFYRGLGFIDFEARKCFTNLEVCDNYVEGANGWAFNGNGKISENITIKNNQLIRPTYPTEVEGLDIISSTWRSVYPYAFTFYSTYCYNINIEGNRVVGGSCGFGNVHNLTMKNNNFEKTGTVAFNSTGDCLIEGNIGDGTRNQLFNLSSSYSTWITSPDSDWYEEEPSTTLIYRNNGNGGIVGNLIDADGTGKYKNTRVIFEGNKFNKFNCNVLGLKEAVFDVSQLNSHINFAARGFKANGLPSYSNPVGNAVVGGFHYSPNELISDSTNNITRYTGSGAEYLNKLGFDYNTIKGKDIYCLTEGTIPTGGEFLMCDSDSVYAANKTVNAGTFVYTDKNLYYVKTAGNLGEECPIHIQGTLINGTAELTFFDKLATIKLKDK